MELSFTIEGESHKFTIQNNRFIVDFKNSENKTDFIKQTLLNGHTIQQCVPTMTQTCGCCEKINEFIPYLEPFQTKGNSARNGQIGEIFACEQFKKNYSERQYIDTSKIEKSGDAILRNENHVIRDIMIDYKNYESQVVSDEVTKLIRDMDAQNVRFGILISYKSKISKTGVVEARQYGNKTILFVAECGLNFTTLLMAVQYIEKIGLLTTLQQEQQISELVANQTLQNIKQLYEKIIYISQGHSQTINTIKESNDKMYKMFQTILSKAYETKSQLNYLVDEINQQIQSVYQEPLSTYHSFREIIDFVNSSTNKPKLNSLIQRVVMMANDLDLSGRLNKDKNCICYDKFKIQITKSKAQVIFFLTVSEDDTINININYEMMKGNTIIIDLVDNPKVWGIINTRLTN